MDSDFSSQKGSILINGTTELDIPIMEPKPSGLEKHVFFGISTNGKHLNMAAQSEKDLQMWMNEINRIRSLLSSSGKMSGTSVAASLTGGNRSSTGRTAGNPASDTPTKSAAQDNGANIVVSPGQNALAKRRGSAILSKSQIDQQAQQSQS